MFIILNKKAFILTTIVLLAIRLTHASTASTTLSVSATVLGDCTIATTPLVLGNYSSGSNLDSSATVTATCTLATPYNIGMDAGAGSGATVNTRKLTRTSGGAQTINYSLYKDLSHSNVWGNTIGTDTYSGTGNGLAQNITVYGSAPSGQIVPAASYADTVNVTITY